MATLITQATEVLHCQGGRMTAQRRLILQTIERLGGHPTAEAIHDLARLQDPTLNASTVYRTLAWLEEVGLVNPRRLGVGRQEMRKACFDPSVEHEHHHFVCTGCGRVVEFASAWVESAKEEFAHSHGAWIEEASLTLRGLCEACRAKAREDSLRQADPEAEYAPGRPW